jgi:hypothetical protein
MVAPMLMHNFTDATAADQALMAAFTVGCRWCCVPSGNS